MTTTEIQKAVLKFEWLPMLTRSGDVQVTDVPEIGWCVCVEGFRGKMVYAAWVNIETGTTHLHSRGHEPMTFDEFLVWLENRPEAAPRELKRGGLFDFEEIE